MGDLIQVFRMSELSVKVRCKILIELGSLINAQYGSNLTEALVLELVRALDPSHALCSDPHYLLHAGEITLDEWKQKTRIGL